MLENLSADDLNVLESRTALGKYPKDVLSVPSSDDRTVGQKVPKSPKQAEQGGEVTPRGRSNRVDFTLGPRAMGLVEGGSDLKVAAPALAACVVVDNPKQ
jgi:hypothetical protein